jgi:hypothetical protein
VVAVITAALGANLPTSVQLYANIAVYWWLLFLLAAAIFVYAWRSRSQSLSFVVSGFAAVIVTLAATSYTFAVILSSLTDMVIAFPSPSLMTASRNSHTAALNIVDVTNAERAYRLKYPEAGFTCNLAELGPPPSGKEPDKTSAGFITTRQAQGSWEGYEVKLSGCTATPSTSFQLTASPVNPGVTGKSAYCSDQSGIISHTGDGKLSSCLEKLKAASELAPSPAAKKK